MATFSLWVEGYQATGQSSGANYLGEVEGKDFNDAVKNYVEKLTKANYYYWSFSNDKWFYWGCRAYDNEIEARKAFG